MILFRKLDELEAKGINRKRITSNLVFLLFSLFAIILFSVIILRTSYQFNSMPNSQDCKVVVAYHFAEQSNYAHLKAEIISTGERVDTTFSLYRTNWQIIDIFYPIGKEFDATYFYYGDKKLVHIKNSIPAMFSGLLIIGLFILLVAIAICIITYKKINSPKSKAEDINQHSEKNRDMIIKILLIICIITSILFLEQHYYLVYTLLNYSVYSVFFLWYSFAKDDYYIKETAYK